MPYDPRMMQMARMGIGMMAPDQRNAFADPRSHSHSEHRNGGNRPFSMANRPLGYTPTPSRMTPTIPMRARNRRSRACCKC